MTFRKYSRDGAFAKASADARLPGDYLDDLVARQVPSAPDVFVVPARVSPVTRAV
jgi:hypothetical protein